MKTRLLTFGCVMLLLASCNKQLETTAVPPTEATADSTGAVTKEYVEYNIKKGEQYCDKNSYTQIKYPELAFKVNFDSSAIYTTVSHSNQNDINKLYGFSDNNAAHHDFSARFGWRWSNNALRLFAYTYNNGVMDFKELGTVAIGAENDCSIKVANELYIFTLNGSVTTMARASTTSEAEGYQLYPFFGGTETAPHDIHIWIK